MNLPEIDLQVYHENACEQIAEALTDIVQVVAAYPRFETVIPKTAITIELDTFTPDNPDDMGTEQFAANLRFVAFVFVSFLEDDAKLLVRKIGARLAAFVYGQRFGCPVGPAKIVVGSPDDMSLPGKTGRNGEGEDYEVWRVEWSHDAFMGTNVWSGEGEQVVEVWTSFAPSIGEGGNYELAVETPTP
jgi:hypothetical protein